MAISGDSARNYRSIRLSQEGGIGGGGVDESLDETLLRANQSPRAINIEFDRESVASVGGALKLNNQAAPRSAIRTRPDKAFSPLFFRPGMAVPLGGAAYFPYDPDIDIGGDFASEGNFLVLSETFHVRRGRTFQLDFCFRLPIEERLYDTPTKGTGAPVVPDAAYSPTHGFDEALDDCFLIRQKGGDRTAPMSWAIGAVNVGAGVDLVGAPATRASNYALVFIWLDSPGWGFSTPEGMRYNLTTAQNPVTGGGSQPCTQAYRAILFHKFIEPGRDYHGSLQLRLDGGTVGSLTTNTAWQDNGSLRLYTWTDRDTFESFSIIDSGAGPTFTGCQVYKGPQDSGEYICKYGVRYSGRDAEFEGLGVRNHPWKETGFIPFGSDLTPLQNGGFVMLDRSAALVASLYGGGVHTLTAAHTAGDAYVVVNHQGLTLGNTNGGLSPYGFGNWSGLGNGSTLFNAEALRGYRLVTTQDFTPGAPPMRGAILNILSYAEVGASFRATITGGAALGTWAAEPILVQAFRWNQRELIIGECRKRRAPQDLEVPDQILLKRRRLMLRSAVDLNDASDPDSGTLSACWPHDDAEGGTLREIVVGGRRNGYLFPFGLGTSPGGARGSMLFLSGEGETPSIDLAGDPVIARELEQALQDPRGGFAIEMSCVFTEAFYAIQEINVPLPDSDTGAGPLLGSRPLYVPDILTFDVRDPDRAAHALTPAPLLALGFRGILASTNSVPFLRPVGLGLEVAHRSDQEGEQPIQPQDLQPSFVDGGVVTRLRYDPNAPWVGRHVTIQIGFQPTRLADDQYDVYISLSPKDAFLPANGDPSDAEIAYWTDGSQAAGGGYTPAGYFTAAHLTIQKKDIVRSVITVGRWNPEGLNGYSELQPRLLLDEVRVFPMPAPGALPVPSGTIVTAHNGKLEGDRALPQRVLLAEDFALSLGTVDLTEGSATVTPAGISGFSTAFPEQDLRALPGGLLRLPGDEQEIRTDQAFGAFTEEAYRVKSVAAGGTSLLLSNEYGGGTRRGAAALLLKLAGYTAFEDDIRDLPLSLGVGTPYNPSGTGVEDVVLTQPLWENLVPIAAEWRLRIFSPLGANALRDIFPTWARGLSSPSPKGNPVLGLYGFKERIYGTTRGALYEFDDRWREDGPTVALNKSLAFRARSLGPGISAPLEADRLVVPIVSAGFDGVADHTTYYDCWVKLDDTREFQTVLWMGSLITDPALMPDNASGHRVHIWIRFVRGRPEFCFGSTATFGGAGARPEKGLFVASGDVRIEPGRWTHVRWVLEPRASTDVIQKPGLLVQGKATAVRVNAIDDGIGGALSTDWVRNSTLVQAAGGVVILGAARDSYRSPSQPAGFLLGAFQGRQQIPQRYHGYLHSLSGRVCAVVISKNPYLSGTPPSEFDPYVLNYDTANELQFVMLHEDTECVGAIHNQAAVATPGQIFSHPAISLFHELGSSDLPASFAEYGERVYVTNGGRVATIGPSASGLAGVLPPTTALGFRIDRFPLWRPNARSAANPENDPVDGAAAGAADQVNHFDNHGNNLLVEAATINGTGLAEIRWTSTATTKRYFGFKTYFKLRETAGRIPLMGRRPSTRSGPVFCDVVDGRVRVGWYDVYQKREVFVETSRQIIEPGYYYYLYLRKRWPQGDVIEGNWVNQFWSDGLLRRVTLSGPPVGTFIIGEAVSWPGGGGGTGRVVKVYGAAATTLELLKLTGTEPSGVITGATSTATGTAGANIHPMNDMLVVRRFRKSTAVPPPFEGWDMQVLTPATERACISFTTDAFGVPAGCEANGMVTTPGVTYTGAGGGSITANFGAPFHQDMISCWFVFGDQAPEPIRGRAYKIGLVNSATNIIVQDPRDGSLPNLAAAVADLGGVFMGVKLVKSEGFDLSRQPDESDQGLQFFGSPLALNPLNGVARFDGEFDTFGITCIDDDDGEDARVFENVSSVLGAVDASEVGTDWFPANIYDAAEPGELHFDDWVAGAPGTNRGTWLSVHGQTYAGVGGNSSTQPNVNATGQHIVAKDVATAPASSANAPDLAWAYLELVSTFAQQRFVRARFFDRQQNARSQPGPELLLLPAADDPLNPSGQIRYVLTNLPAPRQAGQLEVELYMSAAGGSSTGLFLVAVVPVGTREVAVDPLESTIALGLPIDFGSNPPPRCEVVAASRGRMFYGAVEFQKDAVFHSRPGLPVQIDFGSAALPTGFFRVSGGFGDKVTLLKELDGLLVVGKRRALGSVTINETTGLAAVDIVSSGVGCIAHQSAQGYDHWLLFLSDRGLYAAARSGVTNLGKPQWIGAPIERLTLDRADKKTLALASATLNRQRNQYVLALQAFDPTRRWQRATMELFGENRMRYGILEDPRIRTVTAVQDSGGSVEKLVGGTEDGYAVWLDRKDTPHALMGLDAFIYGKPSLESSTPNTVLGLTILNGALEMDQFFDGPRGAPVQYVDVQGILRQTVALWANGNQLLFAEPVPTTGLAPDRATVLVGQVRRTWETPWLSLGDPEIKKWLQWVDFVCREDASGKLLCEVFVDFEDTPKRNFVFEVVKGRTENNVESVDGFWFKIRVRDQTVTAGTAFELTDLILRVTDIGQT